MCRWFDSAPGHQIYTVVSQGTTVFLFVLSVLSTLSPRCPTKRKRRILAPRANAQPTVVYLRNGEVVAYRRTRSLLSQCRYKVAISNRQRQTTVKFSIKPRLPLPVALT